MRKLIAILFLVGMASAQTVLMPMPRQCFNDSLSAGKPLSGGKIFTYQAGTSVQQATFTDATGLSQNTNPVILDVAGCSSIWLNSGQSYRFVAQNSTGVQEWVTDQVSGLATTSAAFPQAITTVAFSANPTFAATGQIQVFKMTLTGNVTSASVNMSGVAAPSIVTFELTQDATGGRTFKWPLNVSGQIPVNPVPTTATTETFIWDGTTLYLAVPVPTSITTIYAQQGESVAHALSRLPSGGGKIIFDVGTYPSGGATISTPNVWLEGSGMPNYNSATAPTALTGGTIFQGQILVTQGADHFVIRNAGVDAGPTWINANNGGTATDGLDIFNNGQVVGAAQVQSPIIENVACLGYSLSAANHCMLVENVNGAYVHNVQAVFNGHGLVLKGQNSKIDGVYSRGHNLDSVIVKSDNYAPATDDTLTNIVIAPLATAGDTKGMLLQGVTSPLSKIQVSKVDISGAGSFGIQVQGATSSNTATDLTFSDITIDYLSPSPTSNYCFQHVQWVSTVNLSNFYCFNYWAGINPNLPQSGFTNDFKLSNGHFVNIAAIGLEAYGRWTVTNSGFIANGTAITADANAVVNVANNQFASNTADMAGAGSYAFAEGTSPLAVASLPTCNAAMEGRRQPVNNANSTTFNSAVAGGGTNHILAYCNGTGWVIH